MNNIKTGHFPPSKSFGLLVHGLILLVLVGISSWSFANLPRAEVGPGFVNYLLLGILAFAPVPFLLYRAYALLRADYSIDRDSLAITWGLRIEDIPLTDIEWMRPVSHLTHPLSLPPLRLPGAILGTRRHPDLGLVEFIASDAKNLILVATSKRVFAISPENPAAMVQTFARAIELGSLTPSEAISVYPSFVITQAWEKPMVRFLWTSGFLLNAGLIMWVGILIPSLRSIPFGFDPSGTPVEAVPSTRLILLPLISGLMFLIGWAAGLSYYRREAHRPLALILWLSSTLCAVLFLLAVLFLVITPLD